MKFAFINSTERLSNVETLIIRVQNSLAYDVCSNIVIYTLHDLNTLTTDICIPIGTMDYIKSKTNSLNLNQSNGLSPDSRNAWHLILHVKQMTSLLTYNFYCW